MPYAKRVVFVLFNLLFLAFLYQLTSLGSFKSSFNELTRFHQLGDSNPKFLFCIVLTTPKGIREKALFALNLWIYRCSDYKIITVIPDVLNSTSNSSRKEFTREPLNLHQPVGYNQENYEKLTDKVIRAFRDIYKTHGDSFDWYFKVDDDSYVNADNLWSFLSRNDPNLPVTFGNEIYEHKVEKGYPAGGSGYVLSKKAFRILGEKLVKNISHCPNTGIEDVDVAVCLRSLSVYPGKSIDDVGRIRFNPFNLLETDVRRPSTNVCCSDEFISIHYMTPDDSIRLDTTVKRLNMLYKQKRISKPTFDMIKRKYIQMKLYEDLLYETYEKINSTEC